SRFDAPAGKGVLGTVDGHKLTIGNAGFLDASGMATEDLANDAGELRRDGATVIFVGLDGKAAGLLAIADPVKPTALDAIKALQSERVRVVMVTGDNKTTAEAVAHGLGIGDVKAGVFPGNKSAVVED